MARLLHLTRSAWRGLAVAAVGLILVFPANAVRADVFDRLTGEFGNLRGADTCAANPHRIRFSDDRTQAFFTWQGPMWSYRSLWEREAVYSVLSYDANGVVMRLEHESRLTDAGETVVWIARPIDRPEGYCWGRTDWPSQKCANAHVRCGTAALS